MQVHNLIDCTMKVEQRSLLLLGKHTKGTNISQIMWHTVISLNSDVVLIGNLKTYAM